MRGRERPGFDRRASLLWRGYGLSMTTTPTLSDMISRTQPDGDCLVWRGRTNAKGYGLVDVDGRTVKAHRLVYQLAGHVIPAGLVVRHTCDRPGCINPEHLVVGSHADNVADRDERGRTAVGESVATARLTGGAVLAIRAAVALGATQRSQAIEYGVDATTIRDIVHGRTWRSLYAMQPAPLDSLTPR